MLCSSPDTAPIGAGSHRTPVATAHLSAPNGTSARGAGPVPNTRATAGWFIKSLAGFRGTLHAPGLPGQGVGMREICFLRQQRLSLWPWMRRSREMSEIFPTPEAVLLLSPTRLELAEPLSCALQDTLSQKAINFSLEPPKYH